MKTLIEKWTTSSNRSFNIKTYEISKLTGEPQEVVMRMHDEYEVTFLVGCSGKRFMGNRIENFSNGDFFIIGPRVPHSIQLDEGQSGYGITIHFLDSAFGSGFFELPENNKICELLQDAKLGVTFAQRDVAHQQKKVKKMMQLQPFERMLLLFKLLNELSQITDRHLLSSRGFTPVLNRKEYELVNKTYAYIINRFEDQTISLDKISAYLSMSPATFCRYFKKHFHKTFSSFLNEVRVGHACKLLQETNKNISEIAFCSGYNQLSNFNRQFKRNIGYSPKEYRNELNRKSA